MMTYIVEAEHHTVPGRIVKVCASMDRAQTEAVNLTKLLIGPSGEWRVTPTNWERTIEKLQEEHGAAHCYVEITTHDLLR